jgi:hypothetical protein
MSMSASRTSTGPGIGSAPEAHDRRCEEGLLMGNTCFMAAFLTWSVRRWVVAAAVGAGTYLFFGLTTAVLANPVFGRSIPPTPWSGNVLVATAILTGLLTATYVRNDGPAPIRLQAAGVTRVTPGERTARAGMVGSLLAYLAIGCPVCNKLALILLGTTGAVNVFAPIQPYLGAIGLALLAVALVVRLRGEVSCATLALRGAGVDGQRPMTTEDILVRLSDQRPTTPPPGDTPTP